MKKASLICIVVLTLISGFQCVKQELPAADTLKDAYRDICLMGTALNDRQIMGGDSLSMDLVEKQFNSITAENAMKWEKIHPEKDQYSFKIADAFVGFGEKHDMFIVGHTLVWHSQTPKWVFEDDGQPADPDTLLKRLKDHIFTVVGRYKGRVQGWDVVNEAFEDNGALRKSPWLNILGETYIEKAFEWAHEADPEAELYYNDFNMWRQGKRDAVVRLVKKLQSEGITIQGIGLQGHWGLDYPPLDSLDMALQAYTGTGLNVMVTEMDVNVLPFPDALITAEISKRAELRAELNPYPDALPDSMQVVLSDRYTDLFKALLKYRENLGRVTFWGVQDGISWTNYWPVWGRTNYPLLFDRNYQPKPAFYRVMQLARQN